MAAGGFKAGQFVFNTTNSTNVTTVGNKVKEILTGITSLIISLEPHWGYDSRYTATSIDYVKVSSGTTYKYQAYAQFLVNSNTGSQLMVWYNPGWEQLFNDASCVRSIYITYTTSTYQGRFKFGLGMSMIPGGSSNTWDTSSDCTTSTLVPNDGTLCVSTSNNSNSNTSTFVKALNTSAKYYVIVKEDIIAIFSGKAGEENLYSGFAVGKIFEKLFNSADNFYYSKYGSFVFAQDSTTTNHTAINEAVADNISFLNVRNNSPFWGSAVPATFFRSDSANRQLSYGDAGYSSPMMAGATYWVNTGWMTNPETTNKSAFTPILVASKATNQVTYGVVPGCGYKGYLDTDFLRGVYTGFAYNTLLDNGKFLYLGGGLAIGWDSSNTVVLRS